MRWLTDRAHLACKHSPTSRVAIRAGQSWVAIEKRRVLIRPDPENRPISGCTVVPAPGIFPCSATLSVQQGYSSWIRIDGRPVCLDTVIGFTVANPQTQYEVRNPGQLLVREA